MTDQERIDILADAVKHQFDRDEDALLAIGRDDLILQAAVRIINHFGSYDDISISANADFIECIRLALGDTAREDHASA